MGKKLTSELKGYKEKFDYLNKEIGELQWEIATIYYGKKAIHRQEREDLEEMLENYKVNMEILLEQIKNEVRKANQSQ